MYKTTKAQQKLRAQIDKELGLHMRRGNRMYLLVVKGKGTSFYNIGVSHDLGIVDYFDDQPFKVHLFSALQFEDQDQAQKIKHYLHHYFAKFRVNNDWFDLPLQENDTLKVMLDDSDNLISGVTVENGPVRTIQLSTRLWQRLEKIAERTGSMGQQGVRLGQASWQELLKRIVGDSSLMRLIEQELNGSKVVSIHQQYHQAVIVRPEDARTETVAWLRVEGNKISLDFPERQEDFDLLTKTLGFRWDGESLSRIPGEWAGDPIDRAAEVGHKLLVNGFCVIFPDESIQEMAIAGEYETECRRWVLARSEGQYEGWFCIRWMWPEDLYDKAKRIAGSRYEKPFVVVPPEQFAEVIDFAEIHNFRFSPGALVLVLQAREMRESALVVSVVEREDEKYPLDLPEKEWKDDDLEDDIEFDDPSDSAS